MRKIVEACPACGSQMLVTRLSCNSCETEVTGKFQTTRFDRLSPGSLSFLEQFVRLRGNVKEMERELGVPYNAVRTRLDEVIRELGFDAPARSAEEEVRTGEPLPAALPQRREVLERLERGEIDPARAVAELEALKTRGGKP
jgi:hypothetical protein